MKELFCKLTGGHKYADSNLRVEEDLKTRKFIVTNWCSKCHKRYSYKISWEEIAINIVRGDT